MHRFFIPPDSFGGPRVKIGREVTEQIRRVLRMRPGDPLTLLDGLGYEYQAVLHSYEQGEAWVDIGERAPVKTEPRVQVTLYLSMLNKPDKYEWALQKCTELGAACFIPVVAERSITGGLSGAKSERWARIIQEAAEQSGRGRIPSLGDVRPLEAALAAEARRLAEDPGKGHVALIPEVEQKIRLLAALDRGSSRPTTVSFFIGPEGGFTPGEMDSAIRANILPVTLGPRILRAETAAVAGLALIMGALGEMEPSKE